MFDVPLTIQHTYVQLGIVLTIKDIFSDLVSIQRF